MVAQYYGKQLESVEKIIEEYEGCSRSHDLLDRTLFCIPLYGDLTFRPPKEDVCLSVHSWRGVVDQIDISLFTSILFRTARMTRIKRFLTSSVTAHLALWDPEVAEVFSRKPWEQILEPRPVLREIAEWRGWDKDLKDENCSWDKGNERGIRRAKANPLSSIVEFRSQT